MPDLRFLLFLSLVACQSADEKQDTQDTEEQEDCPTIALDCPDGQVPCNIATDDPCEEVVLGQEPCTQTRDCMPE